MGYGPLTHLHGGLREYPGEHSRSQSSTGAGGFCSQVQEPGLRKAFLGHVLLQGRMLRLMVGKGTQLQGGLSILPSGQTLLQEIMGDRGSVGYQLERGWGFFEVLSAEEKGDTVPNAKSLTGVAKMSLQEERRSAIKVAVGMEAFISRGRNNIRGAFAKRNVRTEQ